MDNDELNGLRVKFSAYERLTKISRTLHKLDEGDCNGRSERGEKVSETRQKTLMNEAERYAQDISLELHAYHQGDPRGCSLYLVTDEQKKSGQYTQGIAVW